MQSMKRYDRAPLQHINKPTAEGGSSALGALGGLIGGALLSPLGPLGMAVGSSVGSSLGGKGDLSEVTPQKVAINAATAGIPMPGAADIATEGAKATATQAATDAAAAGSAGALSQQATTNLAGMAAPSIGEATKPSFLRSVFSPDGLSNMAKDSAGGFIENPSNVAELGINKLAGGLGQVKDSLFKADGGYINDGSMYSNKGGHAGKGCNCGPMMNCNCK